MILVIVDSRVAQMGAPGGPNVMDVVNQPADVSFLIDTLVQHSNTPEHLLAGMVDEARVGVTGISLGGMTTELTKETGNN